MSPIIKEPSKEQIDLPAGFILRSPTMDDVPGVVAVMNANWQKAAPALRSLDLKLTIAIFRGYGKGWWGFNSGLVLGNENRSF